MIYGSAAWFTFKICLVVFEGNMRLSCVYSIHSVIEFKSLCISFVLHCDLRLNGFVRFHVLFLYIFSYEIFILFCIEFIIVVCLVSKDQEVFDFGGEIIKWNRNYDGQWKKKEV